MSDRIAEIRARLNVATPGPWEATLRTVAGQPHGDWSVQQEGDPLKWVADTGYDSVHSSRADAEFIAHARADVEWLLTALSGDTERLDWLEKHAMRDRPEGVADIRIEHYEGGVLFNQPESGFYMRRWGDVEYDDEGQPDYGRRFYEARRYASLREAIDAAMAARAVEE